MANVLNVMAPGYIDYDDSNLGFQIATAEAEYKEYKPTLWERLSKTYHELNEMKYNHRSLHLEKVNRMKERLEFQKDLRKRKLEKNNKMANMANPFNNPITTSSSATGIMSQPVPGFQGTTGTAAGFTGYQQVQWGEPVLSVDNYVNNIRNANCYPVAVVPNLEFASKILRTSNDFIVLCLDTMKTYRYNELSMAVSTEDVGWQEITFRNLTDKVGFEIKQKPVDISNPQAQEVLEAFENKFEFLKDNISESKEKHSPNLLQQAKDLLGSQSVSYKEAYT